MNRAFLLVIISGFLLGIVLYCWQVSLAAFNDIAAPRQPVRLWSLEKTGAGEIELEFLGKRWGIAVPEGVDLKKFLQKAKR